MLWEMLDKLTISFQEKKIHVWDTLNCSTGQIVVLLKSEISKLNVFVKCHMSSVTCHLTTVLCSSSCYDSQGSIGDEAGRDMVIGTEEKKINSCQKQRKILNSLQKRLKMEGAGRRQMTQTWISQLIDWFFCFFFWRKTKFEYFVEANSKYAFALTLPKWPCSTPPLLHPCVLGHL